MKKLYSASMNPLITAGENGKLIPGAEVCIFLNEPKYSLTRLGEMPARGNDLTTVRFYADPKQLRDMSKGFREMADEAENALAQGIEAAQKPADPEAPPPPANN